MAKIRIDIPDELRAKMIASFEEAKIRVHGLNEMNLRSYNSTKFSRRKSFDIWSRITYGVGVRAVSANGRYLNKFSMICKSPEDATLILLGGKQL